MELNPAKFGKTICPKCGTEIVYREDPIRSIPENKYYWGVLVDILSNELGYSKEEIHKILTTMFLTELKIIKTKNGIKEVWITKSTANLTVSKFEEYLEKIRQWASMYLGIYLPLPLEDINDSEREN